MTSPDLPPVYNLLTYDTVDSAVEEAKRLAAQGAEEGTLVWTRNQSAGHGRLGCPWVSGPGNFYCGIVFRPEDPPAVAVQLNYVTAIGLAGAIATCVSPMTELRYRWPNDIVLVDAKAAGILLEASPPQADVYDWLVVGVAVNLKSHPEDMDPPATSMALDGASQASEVELLESFSRHLLRWLNRWSDDGFAPIRKAWTQRANGIGQPIEVVLKDETVKGKFLELDEQGALVMDLSAGQRRSISVAEFFSI